MEVSRLEKLEGELTDEEIIQFRKWAFVEIKLEARRYFNNVKKHSYSEFVPFLNIWSELINEKKVFFNSDHNQEQ